MRRLIGLVGAVACLGVAGPAAASVTFGADLTIGDSGQAFACADYSYPDGQPGPACVATLVPTTLTSHAPAPVDGIITSFSIRMATPVTGRLRVGTLSDSTQPFLATLTLKGTGEDVSVPGDSVTHSFPARLLVHKGDVIGFASSVAIYRPHQGDNSRRVDRDTADGTTTTLAIMPSSELTNEVPINATIEGDADGDGYGDETQDKCPTLASAHDECPGTVPASTGATGGSDGGSSSPPPPPAAPDTAPPVLSPVTINHPTFRIDSGAAAAKAPKGATLSFITSEAGTARLSVYRLRAGKRSGKRCVAPAPRRSRGKACTTQVQVATIDKPVVAQRNTIAFPGRVHVGSVVRALPPGRYRVDVQVRDAAGNSSNVAGVAFTIVKR